MSVYSLVSTVTGRVSTADAEHNWLKSMAPSAPPPRGSILHPDIKKSMNLHQGILLVFDDLQKTSNKLDNGLRNAARLRCLVEHHRAARVSLVSELAVAQRGQKQACHKYRVDTCSSGLPPRVTATAVVARMENAKAGTQELRAKFAKVEPVQQGSGPSLTTAVSQGQQPLFWPVDEGNDFKPAAPACKGVGDNNQAALAGVCMQGATVPTQSTSLAYDLAVMSLSPTSKSARKLDSTPPSKVPVPQPNIIRAVSCGLDNVSDCNLVERVINPQFLQLPVNLAEQAQAIANGRWDAAPSTLKNNLGLVLRVSPPLCNRLHKSPS